MPNFKVSTIYTAVDKFSSTLGKMTAANQRFAASSQTAAIKANRAFDKLFPSIGAGAKQFLQFAAGGAIFAGLTGAIGGAVSVIADFQQAQASLAAVTGKTVEQNRKLTEDAKRLGAITAKSATEVTTLQESLARLGFRGPDIINMTEGIINGAVAMNAELDRTADLTGAVIKTFDSLGTSDTTSIIDQMTLATQRTALNFEKLETALPIVSGAANAAGISFENTVALLGKLSDAGIDASSSATALRNIFLDSAAQGLSYDQVLNKIIRQSDKLTAANDEFGKRGAVSAVILGKQLKQTKELTAELTALADAEEKGAVARTAANKQLDTLKGAVTLLSSAYEGFVLSLDEGNGMFSTAAKTLIQVVTTMFTLANGSETAMKSLEGTSTSIMTMARVGLFLVKAMLVLGSVMLATKAILVIWRVAATAYNTVLAITTFLTKANTMAIRRNAISLNVIRAITYTVAAAKWVLAAASGGLTAALGIAKAAMAALNVVMAANPIGLVIVAIVALIAAVVIVTRKWDEWGAAATAVFGLIAPPIALIISLVMTLRKHWDNITNAFSKGGFLSGIKAIGRALIDMVLTPMEQILMLVAKIPGLSGFASAGLNQINAVRDVVGLDESQGVINNQRAIEEQRIEREQNINRNSTLVIKGDTDKVDQESSNLQEDIILSSTS